MIASSKDLIHWKKDGEAAKLVPQEGYDKNDWRDPFAIFDQDHGKYVLILGARKPASKKKPTGRLVYFESEDLKDWNFKGDYWANNEFNMIEMPDIFEIDGTWYLLFQSIVKIKRLNIESEQDYFQIEITSRRSFRRKSLLCSKNSRN